MLKSLVRVLLDLVGPGSPFSPGDLCCWKPFLPLLIPTSLTIEDTKESCFVLHGEFPSEHVSNPDLSFGELKDLAFAFADSVAAMYVGTNGELVNEVLFKSIPPPPNERCFLWCDSSFKDGFWDGDWLGSSVVLSMYFVVVFGLNPSVFGFDVKMESKSSSSLLLESWVSTHWSSQYLHLPLTFFLSDSADLCKNGLNGRRLDQKFQSGSKGTECLF